MFVVYIYFVYGHNVFWRAVAVGPERLDPRCERALLRRRQLRRLGFGRAEAPGPECLRRVGSEHLTRCRRS